MTGIKLRIIGYVFIAAGITLARFNKGLAGAFLGSGLTIIIMEFLKHYRIKKK